MPFTLVIAGPRAGEIAPKAAALQEELAGRGITALVFADAPAAPPVRTEPPADIATHVARVRGTGAAAVVLLSSAPPSARESIAAAASDGVLVDWPDGKTAFEPTMPVHGTLPADADLDAGLAELFAFMEGLAYVPMAGTALTAEQDEELVAKLKELGYV